MQSYILSNCCWKLDVKLQKSNKYKLKIIIWYVFGYHFHEISLDVVFFCIKINQWNVSRNLSRLDRDETRWGLSRSIEVFRIETGWALSRPKFFETGRDAPVSSRSRRDGSTFDWYYNITYAIGYCHAPCHYVTELCWKLQYNKFATVDELYSHHKWSTCNITLFNTVKIVFF